MKTPTGFSNNTSPKNCQILSLARENRIEICLCPQILLEITETLLKPKLVKIHKNKQREILAFVKALAAVAIITPGIIEVDVISADPDDE